MSRLFALFLTVAASAGLGACSQPEPEVPPPVRVLVFEVGSQVQAPTRPIRSAESSQELHPLEDPRSARAELEARVLEVLVQPGQRVNEGQALVRLDPLDARLADSSAQVQAAAARAQLTQAEVDFDRFNTLRQQGFISEAEIQRRAAQLAVARADYEAQLDRLGLLTRRALADGTVRSVAVRPGQVVAAGQLLVSIQAPAPRQAPVLKPSSAKAGLEIPLSALLDGKAVMKLEPLQTEDAQGAEPLFRVTRQEVELADVNSSLARVRGGLAQGDRIVRIGGHLLAEGQVVRLAP